MECLEPAAELRDNYKTLVVPEKASFHKGLGRFQFLDVDTLADCNLTFKTSPLTS